MIFGVDILRITTDSEYLE